jgi:hypothetical protein
VNADALASFCSCVSFDVVDQRSRRLMSLPPDTAMVQTLPISKFDQNCRGCGSDGTSVTGQSLKAGAMKNIGFDLFKSRIPAGVLLPGRRYLEINFWIEAQLRIVDDD